MKLAILLPLLMTVSAQAYIPPSRFIIRTMAAKRKGVHLVRITSEVNGYDAGKPTGQRFKTVTLFDLVTHLMKSKALDDSGGELFGVEKAGEAISLNLTVLYDGNSQDVGTALRKEQIPIHGEEDDETKVGEETLALRRWNGSMAWVLGMTSAPKDSSQFWVEKDTFLPVRLLVGDKDIQFTKYRYSQDLPYPRSSSLANRAGVVSLQEEVNELQVNPSLQLDHFTIAAGYTDAGNASPLKELVRKFYAGLR